MSTDNPVRTTAKIWWIVAGVSLVAGIIPFTLFSSYNMPFAIGTMGVVGFLMFFLGFTFALVYMARAKYVDKLMKGEGTLAHWKDSTDETYIGRDGVYVNRKLYMWTLKQGAIFDSVEFVEEKPAALVFSYHAQSTYKVRVPVPVGQEAKARELLEQFKK